MAAQVKPRRGRPLAPIHAAHREALDAASSGGGTEPAVADGANAAPLVVTLPPSAFSPTWKARPSQPVRIGLRLVPETVNDKARANAVVSADRYYPETARDSAQYVEHYNGMLMRGVLAEAVCKPNDVTSSWFKAMAADQIGHAFNERGLARLWQGYAELLEQLSPFLRAAEAADLAQLATRLAAPDAVGRLHVCDRRILGRILEDLRAQN